MIIKWTYIFLAILSAANLHGCSSSIFSGGTSEDSQSSDSSDIKKSSGFDSVSSGISVVYASVPGDDGGWIAIKLTLPEKGRYEESDGKTKAPILVETPPFFTKDNPFCKTADLTKQGVIHVAMIWPGKSDPDTGYASDGTYDYGGPACISALRHVLRFAAGLASTYDGHYIGELGGTSGITPDKSNVGLYGFSHPGIAATIVMATYGNELSGVSYFIGNENPTQDLISAVELGYWTPGESTRESVLNPFYNNPYSYNARDIDLSPTYKFAKWDSETGRPYIDDGEGKSYYFGDLVPSISGKSCYSKRLTHALLDNGILTISEWPSNICTPAEADVNWSIRETPPYYELVGENSPWLKVMLLFSDKDHVQPLTDKPHIHQAWDGFKDSAKLEWVRLNPDNAYAQAVTGISLRELPANQPPSEWSNISQFGYTWKIQDANQIFAVAAVAEMADRTHYSDWSSNLVNPLNLE